MEVKPIKPNSSMLSLSGRKISMSKQVTGLNVDQVKESLIELLEGYEDFVVNQSVFIFYYRLLTRC